MFGYLSLILVRFRTVFGYFRLKKSGNPGAQYAVTEGVLRQVGDSCCHENKM